jgi:hypothetical protein
VDHSLRDDDFEGRHVERERRRDAERPEWLTARGDREGQEFPPAGMDAEAGAYADAAAPPELETRTESARRADGDSWESAVERVEKEDEFLDEGSGAGRYGSSQRASRGSAGPGLQSILGMLSKSPPLVLVALAVIAVVALMMFRPKEEQTVSISAIRHHPERFDGRPVKVKGRVGEVYAVGGGYAFHLYQGRDDIVVFTRSRVPVRREEVTISGSISNGILDGKPRQALFETPH